MFGLFFGAAVGVWVNKSTGVQDAITTSFTLISTFLSGMMIVEIKGLIVKKVPIVPYINPVSLISDSFYSLYYYDDLDRFYVNTSILLFMSVALGVISYLGLRRKTYASI
jgi:ABC-2 type transport system permease protein